MTETKSKPAEIRALAGARAFPPLMIVMFHFCEGHHYFGIHWLDSLVARSYLWVEFFFALSGFVLVHVYAARLAQLFTWRGYGDFLKARLARLYPIHAFMLFALLGLIWWARLWAALGGYRSIYDLPYHPEIRASGFFLSLFLVHGWNTMDRLTWNTPSWFVSVEFALCLLFPLILWLARLGPARTGRGVALIAAGLGGMIVLVLVSPHGLDLTFHNGVLRGLADFSVGAGMAVLYERLKPHDRTPDWVHSVIQCLLLATLLAGFCNNPSWARDTNDLWVVIPMLALLFALAFDRGAVADALKTKVPQLLGSWSYAIYMGQIFWLQSMRIIERRFYPPADALVLGTRFSTLQWWAEPTLLVMVCILWGGFMAIAVEYPAVRLIKRLFPSRVGPGR